MGNRWGTVLAEHLVTAELRQYHLLLDQIQYDNWKNTRNTNVWQRRLSAEFCVMMGNGRFSSVFYIVEDRDQRWIRSDQIFYKRRNMKERLVHNSLVDSVPYFPDELLSLWAINVWYYFFMHSITILIHYFVSNIFSSKLYLDIVQFDFLSAVGDYLNFPPHWSRCRNDDGRLRSCRTGSGTSSSSDFTGPGTGSIRGVSSEE